MKWLSSTMRSSLRKRWHKGFNSLSTEIKIFLHKQASLQPHCPKTYVHIYDRDCSLGCSLHICSIIIADLQIRWRLPVPTAVGTTYALALASHLQVREQKCSSNSSLQRQTWKQQGEEWSCDRMNSIYTWKRYQEINNWFFSVMLVNKCTSHLHMICTCKDKY